MSTHQMHPVPQQPDRTGTPSTPSTATGEARVIDLTGRVVRPGEPDTTPDTTGPVRPETDPDAGWGEPVTESDIVTIARRNDPPAAPEPPSELIGDHDRADDIGSGEVLEGVVLPRADTIEAAPELLRPAWSQGWRHRARRLWAYKRTYAFNATVILGAWAIRASGWWFRGLARSTRDFINFLDDRQGLAVANQSAGALDGRTDVEAWLKARAERHRELKDRRAVARTRLALPLLLLVLVVGFLAWVGQGDKVRAHAVHALALAYVLAGCWLVYYGRARQAPFWPTFREPSPYPPVTNDTMTGALLATQIMQIREVVKNGHSPVDVIFRDDAAGGKVAETHPIPGVTTEMLMAKSVVIAGALKRPPAMVHLSQAATGVPGHVEILVLDIDPGTQKPRRFAYLGKPVNVGKPCTIGYDSRNRPVRWPLAGANGVVTGTPGSGKTAYLLGVACLAALDVEGAQLALFDFKGMGDYSELERVCFAYCAESDPTETARALLAALEGLKGEVIRRRTVLSELKRVGSDLLDNNAAALTDRLARSKQHRMPWILLIIDEVHEALGDPLYGKQITELLMNLMKIGRACGIHVEIASQRTDADSIPTGISSLPIVRVAFHQNGQAGNDQILGTGAYKRGIDATAFRRGGPGTAADDRGSCWFIGSEGGHPVRVRTTFVLPDVKRIVESAYTGRTKAGTLIGAAAGLVEQVDAAPAHSALDDVRMAFVADETALHGDVIFARVETRYPGRWKSQAALIAAVKAEAPGWKAPTMDVGQVRPNDAPVDPGVERTRKGIRRVHLDAAITERDRRQGRGTD